MPTEGARSSEFLICRIGVWALIITNIALVTCLVRVTFFIPLTDSYPVTTLMLTICVTIAAKVTLIIVYKWARTRQKQSKASS